MIRPREMNPTLLLIAVLLATPVAASTRTPNQGGTPVKPAATSAAPLPIEGAMPALGKGEWINSPPLSPADLRGKVVLVNIWNYSCINWIRQVPYVRAWAQAYRDRGLVVIGVNSPEFGFEHDVGNVRRAAKAMGVTYPIVMDNDHAVWRAFENEAWPALYYVDAKGRIRGHYYGEGAYEESQAILQQLLAEAGHANAAQARPSVEPRPVEVAADWQSLRSPETYVGYERAEHFESPGGLVRDKRHVYTAPARLGLNHWALAGDWTIGRQPTVLNVVGGKLVLRFHARDLHLVMGPSTSSAPVRFRVTLDGREPGSDHGIDVAADGSGTVTEPRMYQLIRQSGSIQDHTFEIEFLDAGVETFSFTFG